jgi:hypothetical protein
MGRRRLVSGNEALAHEAKAVLARVAKAVLARAPQPEEVPTEAGLCRWLKEDNILESSRPAVAEWSAIEVRHDESGESLTALFRVAYDADGHLMSVTPLLAGHAEWKARPEPRPEHPVAGLVRAWLRRPRPSKANLRERRIIPAQLAMFAAEPGDARGRLFRAPPRPHGAAQLPLFEAGRHGAEFVTPALPLQLYDLGVNRDSPGAGAPLALRLFVEGVLAVRLPDRANLRPVALEIPMRELLARLYPGRPARPKEWVPAIEAARAALASRSAGIEWAGGRRWIVTMTNLPESLDDMVRLVVDLPPGADTGPQVSPRLHLYGPKRGRHYRALINLAYWWHEPGRTLVPAKGGKHWLTVQDPRRYRKPTDAELTNMVFPAGTHRAQKKLRHDALKVFGDLAKDGELVDLQGKPLPPKPE